MLDPGEVTVRCAGCRREQRVGFADALERGWPVCHGETMQLAGRLPGQLPVVIDHPAPGTLLAVGIAA